MRRVFLHIGTHKTGTTSLQTFLSLQAENLLSAGALYAKSGRNTKNYPSQHFDLVDTLRSTDGCDARCWQELSEEIKHANVDRLVLSAEGFSLCTDLQVKRVGEYFEGLEVWPVVYLRNQWDFMVSTYKWAVRYRNYHRPLRSMMIERCNLVNYHRLLARWCAVFGRDKVLVRMYDGVRQGDGLICDFLSLLGLDPQRFWSKEIRLNEGLPDAQVKLIVVANRLRSIAGNRALPSRLTDVATSVIVKPSPVGAALLAVSRKVLRGPLYCQEDIRWLKEAVRPWNEALFKDFLGSRDESYFDIAI